MKKKYKVKTKYTKSEEKNTKKKGMVFSRGFLELSEKRCEFSKFSNYETWDE